MLFKSNLLQGDDENEELNGSETFLQKERELKNLKLAYWEAGVVGKESDS